MPAAGLPPGGRKVVLPKGRLRCPKVGSAFQRGCAVQRKATLSKSRQRFQRRLYCPKEGALHKERLHRPKETVRHSKKAVLPARKGDFVLTTLRFCAIVVIGILFGGGEKIGKEDLRDLRKVQREVSSLL